MTYMERMAGIPKLFQGTTISKEKPRNDEQERYIGYLKKLANKTDSDPWWALSVIGTPGNGKSRLACSMINAWNDRMCMGAIYVTQEKLLDDLREAVGNGTLGSAISRYYNASFLVIDELTQRDWTGWAKNNIQKILSYRHSMGMRTVLIGNVTTNEYMRMFDPHILSRLKEGMRIAMIAPDMRVAYA